MRIVRGVLLGMASCSLAVLVVGTGFLACLVPPVTSVLAGSFADDATSPFNRAQLVRIAEATRDYSFGSHDLMALYQAIYQINLELRAELEAGGDAAPAGLPALGEVGDPGDAARLEAALAGMPEAYAFSKDTVSHLDDCHAIARAAYVALAALAVIALAALASSRATGRTREIGCALRAAGIMVLAVFVTLGIWAAVDFQRFFAAFHGVFFSQGNWQFPIDSLLICALPTGFWAGMGAVWLAVCAVASVACIVAGTRLCGRRPAPRHAAVRTRAWHR